MIITTIKKFTVMGILALLAMGQAIAADRVQPFVLASQAPGNHASVAAETKQKLQTAGFEIVGSYAPYADAEIIIFTNNELKQTATKSKRGGYGAAMRASVTKVNNDIQVAYTNPIYWANAYRLESNLDRVGSALSAALGKKMEYSSGEKQLTAKKMRKYHYTFMMEYFDDPSELGEYDSHAEAVKAVEANLAASKGATSKVYRIDLGKDPKGKQMTLFGVALNGSDADDCSGDAYIMGKIDHADPRSTAHLPYEVMVYGDEVEALYARFRIAISWPHLPMMASKTGATFMSIMCAPGSIESALEQVGGYDS